MKDAYVENLLTEMESRVAALEEKVFGDDVNSKSQQKRQVIEEVVQINGQIQRAVANRDAVAQLMKNVEEMMEYLEVEESNQLLGGEAKANAVIAAEPVIRQMFSLVKSINLDDINEAMNSEAIRNLTTLTAELAKVRLVQMEQKDRYELFCQKVGSIEEVISILGEGVVNTR
ncbi:hypothetical protein Ocin01_07368 [Orchesella cincta]|uniref:Uncharacterized protein n=1 Tax=Orchesella cincta TaxID=48709 RepID=A0A1D2N2N4_ORCCI|nr:hypothetical protein Ocin01_07368 [Orchesella cincta]